MTKLSIVPDETLKNAFGNMTDKVALRPQPRKCWADIDKIHDARSIHFVRSALRVPEDYLRSAEYKVSLIVRRD